MIKLVRSFRRSSKHGIRKQKSRSIRAAKSFKTPTPLSLVKQMGSSNLRYRRPYNNGAWWIGNRTMTRRILILMPHRLMQNSRIRSVYRLPYAWNRRTQWFIWKVLKVTSVAHAKEFLRLSQGELHFQLHTLKTEYVDAIRRLGEEAKSFRINALRDALQHGTALQAELRDDIIGECPSICVEYHRG
jgi:hypothetical protein